MPTVKEHATSTTDFTQYQASHKLMQLAKHPFDLTLKEHFTPERLSKFIAEACGYKFLYGTERITEETMHFLMELATQADALQKMEKMQSGEVMNFIQGFPSENRPVMHTAVRDFFDHPNQAKEAMHCTKLAHQEAEKLKAFIAKLDKENRFTDLIMVGIGGSDLGLKAHYIALEHLKKPERSVYFVSNIDPDSVAMVLRQANLKKTLVVINSKSGITIETVVNEEFLRSRFEEAGLRPEEHFISISCEGTPLDNPKKYLECFHVWDWIGGRFSSTSVTGGFLLSFAFGFDTYWEFLRGANAMDKTVFSNDLHQNLPLLGALLGIWNRNFLGYPNLAIVPYSQALSRYAAHVQQVDMESNGKSITQTGLSADFDTGPIVMGEPGTAAQHSFYQLLHQGTTIVPMELIGFKYSQCEEDYIYKGASSQEKLLANVIAQSIALATGRHNDNPNKNFPGNRPSHLLLTDQLTPYSLGVLLAYFEHKIAFQGFIWGINSFDQEGVQLGKELANKIIDCMAANNGIEVEDKKPYPLGDVYLKVLETI